MVRSVGRIHRAVGDNEAFPVQSAAARKAPQYVAGEGIERAHCTATEREHHIVGDDRRRSTLNVLPLGHQGRIAIRVEVQPQTGSAIAIDHEDPRAAIGRVDPHRGLSEDHTTLGYVDDRTDFPAEMPRSALAAQVREIEQAQLGVLAALHRELLDRGIRGDRQDRGRGAAQVSVAVVQRLKIGCGVAIERFAGVGARTAGAVRMQRDDRFAPVLVAAVVCAIAGTHEYSIRAGIVDDAGTRPDRVPGRSTGRRHAISEMLEMNGLVAAGGVEDSLRTRREVDRGHVALIVAVVARIAAVHDVKIADAVRGRDRQRRRTLLIEALESRQLRPPATDDFGAVADLVLVHVPVETVAVDVVATRIDRR